MSGRKALVLAALFLLSCGGGQTRGHPLDAPFEDADGSELEAFAKAWRRPPAKAVPNVIIRVVYRHSLVGQTIGKKPWQFIHCTGSRPMIAGELVVTMGAGELTALDAETGEVEWTVKAHGRLRGVDDDGRTT